MSANTIDILPPLPRSKATKIAVPVVAGRFCEHFGGAAEFQIYHANRRNDGLAGVEKLEAPEHKPGAFPRWLADNGVNAVVVSSVGGPALKLLARLGIRPYLAIEGMDPAALATACLLGRLEVAGEDNTRCHGHEHHHDHGHACGH